MPVRIPIRRPGTIEIPGRSFDDELLNTTQPWIFTANRFAPIAPPRRFLPRSLAGNRSRRLAANRSSTDAGSVEHVAWCLAALSRQSFFHRRGVGGGTKRRAPTQGR